MIVDPKDVLPIEYSQAKSPTATIARLISVLSIVFGSAVVGAALTEFIYMRNLGAPQSNMELSVTAGNALGGGLLIAGGLLYLTSGYRRFLLATLIVYMAFNLIEMTIRSVELFNNLRNSSIPRWWLIMPMMITSVIVMVMFPVSAFLVVRRCR